jgi:hypothetical protein
MGSQKLYKDIKTYFDLVSDVRVERARDTDSPLSAKKKITIPPIVPQYVALVLGILIQPFFSAYQINGTWEFQGIWGRLLFSVIAGIIILPSVYKNAFDPDKPLIIQLCLIFVAGIGWENLLSIATTTVQ